MLRALRIRNLALLEEVDLDLGGGLTVLTGETGAGKTILVEALGLALGDRASTGKIRSGADAAEVEAVFDLEGRPDAVAILEDAGIDADDGEAVVRRVLSADGRSRAHLNGSHAPLGVLRRLGDALVERHGQHEQQTLLRPETHRLLLDRLGRLTKLVAAFHASRDGCRAASHQLEDLEKRLAEKEERSELLRLRLSELQEIDPGPGEDDRLAEERAVLGHAERVRTLAGEAFAWLYDDEHSALARLDRSAAAVRELGALGAGVPADAMGLEEARALIDDAALALRDLAERAVDDPGRLAEVEDRLAALDGLRKRYGSLAEAIAAREEMAVELEELESADASLQAARRAREETHAAWAAAAERLREGRLRAARVVRRRLEAELHQLAMPAARLGVEVGRADGPDGPAGVDAVRFLLAANAGEEAGPLDRVASGGELSRVMLAMNTVLEAGLPPRTLVFDEVDSGLGGRAADEVGERLSGLAERHQVLCVTHVPQIARRPGRHLLVVKETIGKRTRAVVEDLPEERRVEEIARMLGGRRITETTRRHAAEMLRAGGGEP